MENPTFTELLAGLTRGQHGRIEADIPEGWMQGRTTYGGLTAALCLESARTLAEDVPVRSVQVAFIGPVGGHVVISPSILRQGRSATYVNVDVVSENGIMARAIFVFGAHRNSTVRFNDVQMPEVPRPDAAPSKFGEREGGPSFSQHFDMKIGFGSIPFSGTDTRDMGLWLRHRSVDEPDSPTALLALADAPPPAVMPIMTVPAPTSSMTWMAEFMSHDANPDGWYFAHQIAEAAGDGYSNQRMVLFADTGVPVMVGRQTVAMFS